MKIMAYVPSTSRLARLGDRKPVPVLPYTLFEVTDEQFYMLRIEYPDELLNLTPLVLPAAVRSACARMAA